MLEIVFIYPTPEGSQEILMSGDRISFGRGSESDHRFADDGLSRLHATVYRDGERVWIVDENSTNGSFVNGEKVMGSGTILRDGDQIKIGHFTSLKVKFNEKPVQSFTPPTHDQPAQTSAAPAQNFAYFVPIAVIAVALFVVSVSAVFIGYTGFGSDNTIVVQADQREESGDEFGDEKDENEATPPPMRTPKIEKTMLTGAETNASAADMNLTDSPEAANAASEVNLPSGKKYLEMSDAERRQYLEARAVRVAQIIGNRASDKIPPAAIDKIKSFADGYAQRIRTKAKGGCGFGDNLQTTFERASKNAPFIVRAFNEKGIDPRIGLYLAMIESEHCVCLQSPTGPLGMFQFTFATAKLHFEPSEGVRKGASPANPDDRCLPEPAARAAASYMKALTGRYGTGPASVPLAIGSYNSGEGGLSTNLQKALESGEGLPRDFWTLISKGEILSKQFQSENFKYVPKFFAAAIIGENPPDFGLNLQPLSTYSK